MLKRRMPIEGSGMEKQSPGSASALLSRPREGRSDQAQSIGISAVSTDAAEVVKDFEIAAIRVHLKNDAASHPSGFRDAIHG